MLRPKVIFLIVMLPVILSSSCAPGAQYTLPNDMTLVSGADVSQQLTTVTSDIFTQTLELATSTPIPDVSTIPPSSSGLKLASSETPAAVATDKPGDGMVQSILMTIQFTPPSSTTYYATLADNGRTFYMKTGDELRINLDMSYIWSIVSINDPAVIAGAQTGYFAFANGTATLTMTGNPECLNLTPPCGMPSIIFTITVVVQ